MTIQLGGETTLPSRMISIISQGPSYCAVCASWMAGGSAVEYEVSRRNFGATEWKIAKGPMLDGRPNPRRCPHDPTRRHWLVVHGAGGMPDPIPPPRPPDVPPNPADPVPDPPVPPEPDLPSGIPPEPIKR